MTSVHALPGWARKIFYFSLVAQPTFTDEEVVNNNIEIKVNTLASENCIKGFA